MIRADFDVAIIGSGLGGLTAGAILAKHGRKVCVIEKNTSLGGAASTYKVGPLMVEAALHQTAHPSSSADPKHAVLKRLGLLDALEWVPVGPLYSAEGGPLGDEPFVLGTGFDAVREAVGRRFSPGAARMVDDMRHVHEALGAMTEARDSHSLVALARGLAGVGPLVGGWKKSLAEVMARDLGDDEAAKFALAANLAYYGNDPARLWWLAYAVAQSGYIAAGGTFIKGGSMRLALKLAKIIRDAGGEVVRGRRVTAVTPPKSGQPAVVTHKGKPEDGEVTLTARAVAANCAPHALAAMLDERASERLMERYVHRPLSLSLFSVHYGLRADAARKLPQHFSTMLIPPWMTHLSDFAGAERLFSEAPGGQMPLIGIANHGAIDSGLESEGLMLVSVVAIDAVANWANLDRERERERRDAWTDAITAEIDRRWPGFAGAVEQKVVLNARAIRDYLGAPEGAIYGFALEPPTRSLWFGLDRSPKTPLDGVFLASSYAGSGGYSGAMGTGAMAGDAIESWLKRQGA